MITRLLLFIFIAFPFWMRGYDKAFASEEAPSSSLEGLKGISVSVMPPNPEAESNGVKREEIQTIIGTKLGKAEIKILTGRELEKPGFPYLNVTINATKNKNSEIYDYNVNVELYKQEILNPQDEIETAMQTTSIKTWSSEKNGTSSGSDLKKNVQKKIEEAIDKFINDYLTANPKK